MDTENILEIIKQQKKALSELEEQVEKLMPKDKESLQEECKRLKEKSVSDDKLIKSLTQDNAALKQELKEKLFAEKVGLVNSAMSRLRLYFRTNVNAEIDDLKNFENDVCMRINGIRQLMHNESEDFKQDILKKLSIFENHVFAEISRLKEDREKEQFTLSQEQSKYAEELATRPVTENLVLSETKKYSVERVIGLKILNWVGTLFIIIGVIALAQLAYVRFNDIAKTILLFCLGGAITGFGQFLVRRNRNFFTLSILSLGIAIIYAALSISYFSLGVFNLYVALGICVAITALAYFLSLYNNSQGVAVFSQAGVYLPLLTVFMSKDAAFSAMLYFTIVSLSPLIISFKKKWIVLYYIGFSLNLIGTTLVTASAIHFLQTQSFNAGQFFTLLYVIVSFATFTLMPVISSHVSKKRLLWQDSLFLGLNTLVKAILLIVVCYAFKLGHWSGLVFIIMCIGFFALAAFNNHKMVKDSLSYALFCTCAFALSVISAFALFDIDVVTFAFLALCAGFLITGIIIKWKSFVYGGWGLGGVALFSFLVFDLLLKANTISDINLFIYKYLAVTTLSIGILLTVILKKPSTALSKFQYKAFMHTVVLNFWSFATYLLFKLFGLFKTEPLELMYYFFACVSLAAFLIGYFINYIPVLKKANVKFSSLALYAFGILILIAANFAFPIAAGTKHYLGFARAFAGSALLVFVNAASVFVFADALIFLGKTNRNLQSWSPLMVWSFLLVTVTYLLMAKYGIKFNNISISIIHIASAFLWIIFGFMKKAVIMRRFGLGLTFLSIGKLFIIDLWGLSIEGKVIAYFAFGIITIIISFAYQQAYKRLIKSNSSENLEETSEEKTV